MEMICFFKLVLHENSLTTKPIFTNNVRAIGTNKFFLTDQLKVKPN